MGDYWVDLLKGESPIREWDKLILGDVTWPGLCTFEPSISMGVDVAKLNTNPNAKDDPPKFEARLVDKGYNPGDLRAIVSVWEQDQWEDLKETMRIFRPSPSGKITDAYDILHPATALLGITTVIIIGIAVRHPINQTLSVELTMKQWFPRLPHKTTRPNGGPIDEADFNVAKPDASKNVG